MRRTGRPIRGEWATQRGLAEHVDIVHDAEVVLTVGVRQGRGIGLIVGTGSVAMGVNAGGEQIVIGGWGHLFGDQGSGFDLGRRALAAVADAVDGIGVQTILSDEIMRRLQRTDDTLGRDNAAAASRPSARNRSKIEPGG